MSSDSPNAVAKINNSTNARGWGVRGHHSAQFNWFNKHLLRIKQSLEPVPENKGPE